MGNKDYHFPFIWIQEETVVNSLCIDHLHRREYVNPIATIQIEKDAVVKDLKINDLTLENHTADYCSSLNNFGVINRLCLGGLSENEIDNEGTIEEIMSV